MGGIGGGSAQHGSLSLLRLEVLSRLMLLLVGGEEREPKWQVVVPQKRKSLVYEASTLSTFISKCTNLLLLLSRYVCMHQPVCVFAGTPFCNVRLQRGRCLITEVALRGHTSSNCLLAKLYVEALPWSFTALAWHRERHRAL